MRWDEAGRPAGRPALACLWSWSGLWSLVWSGLGLVWSGPGPVTQAVESRRPQAAGAASAELPGPLRAQASLASVNVVPGGPAEYYYYYYYYYY